MKKQPLSQKLLITGSVLLLIATIVIFIQIRSILLGIDKDENVEFILLAVGFILLLIGFYLVIFFPVLEFDENYLYITRNKNTKQIPLSNVYKIKATMIRVNFGYLWKIGYTDLDGKIKAVRFSPKYFSDSFEQFREIVKKNNPKVFIQNWSWTFDFDQ